MIKFLKKRVEMLSEKFVQYEKLRIDAENEDQAMSSGLFNPRFLAKVRRSKACSSH